jgi:hypothetical protein
MQRQHGNYRAVVAIVALFSRQTGKHQPLAQDRFRIERRACRDNIAGHLRQGPLRIEITRAAFAIS